MAAGICPDINHNRILLDLCLYFSESDLNLQLNPPVDTSSLRNAGFTVKSSS
jgi:hypothetical protein